MGSELELKNFELPFHCLVTSSATIVAADVRRLWKRSQI